MDFKQGSPTAGTDAADKSNGDFGTSRWQLDQQGTLASVSAKGGNGRFWPDSEVAECSDDFRFLEYSGLVVLTASLSESDHLGHALFWISAVHIGH